MSDFFRDDYSMPQEVFEKNFEKFTELIKSSHHITVFTGAGVSTLSGIPDFRGQHGVYTDPWMGMNVEDIISMTFFRRRPDIFYKWAKDVWYRLEDYEPNVVHKVLAEMESKHLIGGVYTQNIDMLHQKAGSKNVWEVHGSPRFHRCTKCGKKYTYSEIAPLVLKDEVPLCKSCGGVIKPEIVFYEESLPSEILEQAWKDFASCDLCLVLGSSLTVQPAASFPMVAGQNGAKLVIVNAQETYQDSNAAVRFTDLRQTFEALDRQLSEL
ncbi:MAG: NAD-dependent protein deacylase [Sphaerochaetaceae bacterium]|nr:NAD-dependent protein deacylase [Sphaerochaetaceae bacterium]